MINQFIFFAKTALGKLGLKSMDSGWKIFLPEYMFQKCPASIPNGMLEGHCGPTLDWLCNFRYNESYRRHSCMTGDIKGLGNEPEKLLCGEEGVWMTGYEDIELYVSGVCIGDAEEEKLYGRCA